METPTDSYFIITRDGKINPNGLEDLTVSLYLADGAMVGVLPATSGQPSRQTFLKAADRPSGQFHPLPEGVFTVGNLDWCGARGNYNKYWNEGLGPVVADLTLTPDYWTQGGDFLFHLDGNRATAPGSAGCVVFPDFPTLAKWAGWMHTLKPKLCYANWGLGTVHPPGTPKPVLEIIHYKLFHHPGNPSTRIIVGGAEEKAFQCKIDYHNDKLGVVVNGKQLGEDEFPTLTLDIGVKMKKKE